MSQSPLRLFLFLCVFRVLNTFLIQSYFDPDEFWQTLEPAYCTVFRRDQGLTCSGFTWEWKRRHPDPTADLLSQSFLGPARSYLSVLPTDLFYRVLQSLQLDTSDAPFASWLVARGPMILYALTVAAPCDLAVWYAAKLMYTSASSSVTTMIPSWCLFASLFSWFNAYSMVRTFANAQEALLLILSICLVGQELLAENGKPNKNVKHWRARAAFFLGGMSVSIRGTSVAAYVPMGILLAVQERTWVRTLNYLFSICALYGLLGIGLAVVVDYWYFGFVTLPFLGNFHFNVVLDYASLFGAHPWHWYLTAGTPALAGILLPLLVSDLVALVPGGQGWSKGRRNLWIIVVTYLVAMSTNAHKEFRYILPLLPIFCLLTGEQLQKYLGTLPQSRRGCLGWFSLAVIVIANLIAVLYLGLFHQSGPVTVNREILRLATRHAKGLATRPEATTLVSRHGIGYFTGACHSTPLLSALHTPLVHFETRSLDCSPSCRADPNAVCETDQFHHDPLGFLQSLYPTETCGNTDDGDDNENTCRNQDALPSFVVTKSNYADDITDFLTELGLVEVARFPNNLSGAKIAGHVLGDDFSNPSHNHIQLSDMLEISIEEVVLFAHKSLQE